MTDLIQLRRTEERPKAPRPEDLQLRFSERAVQELEALATHYPNRKACVLPGLWIAQREYGGFLSPEAIAEVAHRLGRSFAEIEGVATFYSMYNTRHAPGKHMIEVCTCLTCHVCGAYPLLDHLREKLGIDLGETTPDGLFTLHEVECLNACDRAPVVQIGPTYHGPMDRMALDKLIDGLRAQEGSTVVQLANDIVQVQLAKPERQA